MIKIHAHVYFTGQLYFYTQYYDFTYSGGKILSWILERNEVTIEHAILNVILETYATKNIKITKRLAAIIPWVKFNS